MAIVDNKSQLYDIAADEREKYARAAYDSYEDAEEHDRAVDRAMRAAVRDALIEHKRAGQPIAVWQDDKVVWIRAEEIVIPEEP